MRSPAANVSRRAAWVMAARPQTLPVGAAPVVVGAGVAVEAGVFAPLPWLGALVGAVLIQIGTNFANDYHDAVRGADPSDRAGFTRVTAAGMLPPAQVKRAAAVSYGLAVLVGTYLVAVGGVPVLIVGVTGIVAGTLYTGGPYPYGYRGLGDLFVFLYFGIVAVTGSYYVQAVTATDSGLVPVWIPSEVGLATAAAASLPAAGLSTAVLVVNNVRDRETDAEAGKRTLAVILGYRGSRIEFLGLVGLAYVVPVGFAVAGTGIAVLAPLLSAPLAGSVTRTVLTRTDGPALNHALERTGQTLFVHSLLFAAGLGLV